ncbi:MAG: hypothetical protein H6841_07510 [Planctomycetes bacterium]|nr:hypothetical protein [Planctomycetota bacterium]MCB9935204.1 hypothetical protein [Planctomycetota bacterium]
MPARLPVESRRGSVLEAALLLFVVISVAGIALLSMSTITRLGMVRSSYDVRLLIAAEAGLEAMRGRFTLVPGVQEDWSALLPTNGWNDIGGPMTINGLQVQVQAMPMGYPGLTHARIRGIATGAFDRNRVVEYKIQAANFADYALFFGSNNTTFIGSYFKCVGNFYSKGSINLSNQPGIEFFGDVDTSEKVLNYVDYVYNFKKGFTEYAPVVTIPPEAYGLAPMRAAAEASGTLFYANTISIELVDQHFVRTFEYRFTGTGTNYNPNHYELRTELLEIPDNSVIYIDSGLAPQGVDSWGLTAQTANKASHGELDVWGVLDYKRVTIACEHDVRVTRNVSYRTLLDNPNLRRFTEKTSEQALGYREMLGVLSNHDITFETILWAPLPDYADVTDDPSRDPPDIGHHANQYSLDGVYMGVNKAARGAVGPATSRELWVCGGIINGDYPSTALASNFDRRNYDTDYRLQFTTPPYFMKAYGESANIVVGTWRTYTL